MKIRYYMIVLLVLCTHVLYAQVKFTSSSSRSQVGTGETFEVTFSLNGNGSSFTAPDFNGFQVVSGPNVSSSYSSINGRTSVSNSYSFYLTTIKEGTYTIDPASIVVDGRRLLTSPITVKVNKGQIPQQNKPRQAPDLNVAPSELAKSIFIKAVVDKSSAYQGEQVTLSFRLYTRVGIVDSRLDKLPDLNGFWSEDIKNQAPQAQWRTEMYKGVKYNVADVKKTILCAEHSGNITINPFEMTFIVRLQAPSTGGDLIDQFFGSAYKDVTYNVKSTPVVVHVKPLPEAGKPSSFTGAVGKFNITAGVDKSVLKSNESLNYNVKISGAGNIKLLKELNAEFPPDVEKYDPKITDTLMQDANGLNGSRIYSYLLIPRHQGDFTIAPLEFSYFNPATARYVTLSTKPILVKVSKGIAESNVTAFSSADKQDVKLLDKDIRYIKTDHTDLSDGSRYYGTFWYFLLLTVGPLLCIAGFIYRNWNRKNNSDPVLMKSKKAGKMAARHLATAETQLKANRKNEFYDAVFKGLYGYLSDKFNISIADLNKETIVSALRSRSVSEELITQLIDTLDICEMARYAPVTHLSEQEVLDKAKNIINNIEHEI